MNLHKERLSFEEPTEILSLKWASKSQSTSHSQWIGLGKGRNCINFLRKAIIWDFADKWGSKSSPIDSINKQLSDFGVVEEVEKT